MAYLSARGVEKDLVEEVRGAVLRVQQDDPDVTRSAFIIDAVRFYLAHLRSQLNDGRPFRRVKKRLKPGDWRAKKEPVADGLQ